MAIPLNEVQKIEQKASKPGNIINKYVKVQDINNSVNECKTEIFNEYKNGLEAVNKVIDKWLMITK